MDNNDKIKFKSYLRDQREGVRRRFLNALDAMETELERFRKDVERGDSTFGNGTITEELHRARGAWDEVINMLNMMEERNGSE